MSVKHSLVGKFYNPRFWVLSANLSSRGSGFITTFLIARTLGRGPLGEYSVLVNTASSVIQPFLQVMTNNSTLLAVEQRSKGPLAVWQTAFAHVVLTAALAITSFVVFLVLRGVLLKSAAVPGSAPLGLGLVAAASFIVGQLCGGVFLGSCYGTNKFVASALVSVAVSLASVVLVVPAVFLRGLAGAYLILATASWVLPLALAFLLCRGGCSVRIEPQGFAAALKQFKISLPSVARTAVGAAVYWLCTIYFVQMATGLEGVAIVAVAMQWLTLMLLATSSWGGFSLTAIAEAVTAGSLGMVHRTTLSLLKENVAVTLVGCVAIVVGADWIAALYGLTGTSVPSLLRLNAAVALVTACNTIFERILLCVHRQKLWFYFSIAGFAIQVAITAAFIEAGLIVVILGSLASSAVVLILCCLWYIIKLPDTFCSS